ncbi:hypothetical protein K504DRAFT_447920 [Pleomassaria siparia CBS 279.74]|uniref:Uncharacterized protein n=1 Tax=Pleomassaria siparia CBS 279.74 TaxID=1314801 RepID=A0A6G1K0D8_9PLEO|nr:hypothetical protein K504DRAFT_447920 [Pleomassaria siparia CBS 279.74]
MASYFDIKPSSSKDTSGVLKVPDGHPLKSHGMLTPQVTRLVDDLFLEEDHSSSDDDAEEGSLSEDSDPTSPKDTDKLRKSQPSPLPETKHVTIQPSSSRQLGEGSTRKRHPRMERFHSLRTMLFSSKIADGMAKHSEERAKAEAEEKWLAEHELRKGLNRPKTPESSMESPPKEGFTHRMGDKLKRMTSKEPPTMKGITEENNNVSTASSEDDDDDEYMKGIREDRAAASDVESINHSDVEDLARWVSRRDPPSDGEARKPKEKKRSEHIDSGHESLGQSDVEDLVRWVGRKKPLSEETAAETGFDHSDTPGGSDSEAGMPRKETIDDADTNELVRWISRKEGPKAGPVREIKAPLKTNMEDLYDMEDSDGGGEFSRWAMRQDGTSGEDSDVPSNKNLVPRSGQANTQKPDAQARGSLAPQDVDELVGWLSRRNETSAMTETSDEEPRGRSPRREDEATPTNEGVDDPKK